MARTTVAAQNVPSSGLSSAAITMTSVSSGSGNGIQFVNDGAKLAYFVNGSGSPITLTVRSQVTLDGLVLPDRTITLPANGYVFIDELTPSVYNDVSTGMVFIDASASCTAAILS